MVRADKLRTELTALETMSPAELQLSWSGLSRRDLLHASPSLLRHLIARRIQEKAFGKLASQVERELDRLGGKISSEAPSSRRQGLVLPGTRFIREWNGKTIAVIAIEGGFEWNSETYRSLSEIARAVTGAHWSGPRFFGLTSNRA